MTTGRINQITTEAHHNVWNFKVSS